MCNSTCSMRFYEELNDFLPEPRRKVWFCHHFQRRASIKDMIEAQGIPHTEVELILVNGDSVDFSYIVQDGDWISVYPMFEAFDVQSLVRVRPETLRVSRFVLDVHLGKLARYLRLLGFDTLYRNDYEDASLARLASEERRILLTRDRDLLKRAVVIHGYYVRSVDPRRQIEENHGAAGSLSRYSAVSAMCTLQWPTGGHAQSANLGAVVARNPALG